MSLLVVVAFGCGADSDVDSFLDGEGDQAAGDAESAAALAPATDQGSVAPRCFDAAAPPAEATTLDQLEGWTIVVDSIGDAGADIVDTLSVVAPEVTLARVFQAPFVLATGLSRDDAQEINETLRSAGLDSPLFGLETPDFDEGGADHEIALVVHDVDNIESVVNEIVHLCGVAPGTARALLAYTPTLLGVPMSVGTVEVLRKRFARLGVEVDVTRPADAVFDVLWSGSSSANERAQIVSALAELGVSPSDAGLETTSGGVAVAISFGGGLEATSGVVAMGLDKAEADRLLELAGSSSVRILSRDFERFDVTLDAAPDTPEMRQYLVSSTGMPDQLAADVIEQLPIVFHQSLGFEKMTEVIEAVNELGGRATGHLLLKDPGLGE